MNREHCITYMVPTHKTSVIHLSTSSLCRAGRKKRQHRYLTSKAEYVLGFLELGVSYRFWKEKPSIIMRCYVNQWRGVGLKNLKLEDS